MNTDDIILYFIVLTPVLAGIIFALYIKVIKPFSAERRYLKAEIDRAYDESEYLYWRNELKKLYVSLIPIIGKRLSKTMR